MIYPSGQAFRDAPEKRLTLFGMSGLGKTYLAQRLRDGGDWFHYSVDYRIGTAYLGEHIADELKREAMKNPFLARLLRTDSIYVGSNITFENLAPLSAFLGQPGDAAKGGLSIDEYRRRQDLHRRGEVNALLDTPHFVNRAREIYGYGNFICDTGGSICEVVNPHDPADTVMTTLAAHTLPVWLKGDEAHIQTLLDRFAHAPKPIYFRPAFLDELWDGHLDAHGLTADAVDPDAFARAAYRAVIDARRPRYAAMAEGWGIAIPAAAAAEAATEGDVIDLIAGALP